MTNIRTKELLERYGGAVPRYTSYPTAVQFESGFAASLPEEMQAVEEISLYVHIPFCRSLCSYCGCTMRVVHDDEPIEEYLKSLETEISIAGSQTGSRLKASHIHFGGGSPNLLSPAALERVLQRIDANFPIRDGAEIAMEADPRRMTREKALGFAVAGVNRISLGVQDFRKETQIAINRIQPFEMIESCVGWLRDSGIKSINFDLMYGLPYQTVETIEDNVARAATLEPNRVSVFGYAHVPWMKPHQKVLERHPMAGGAERFEQAEAARRTFIDSGYTSIGMDHFCRPDDALATALANHTLKRNFQGYTTDTSAVLLGFGLSAISRLPNAYSQNTANFRTYREALLNGSLPMEKGCVITAEDALRAALISELMCYFSVDIAAVCKSFGFPNDFFAANILKLRPAIGDGLLEMKDGVIRVTEVGRPFIRAVCATFDTYLETGSQRHARVV